MWSRNHAFTSASARGWNRLGRRLRRHDRKLRPLEVFSKERAGRALIGTLMVILIVTHLVPHVHPGTQNGTRTLLLGALIVRIGVWGPFYYTHNKELFRKFPKRGDPNIVPYEQTSK